MAIAEKIVAAESEVERLALAKKSEWARAIDTANLVDAMERLRLLHIEAEETIRVLMREPAD